MPSRDDATGAQEDLSLVLLNLQKRIKPTDSGTAILDDSSQLFSKAACALHSSRARGMTRTTKPHGRRNRWARLIHDLGHQTNRFLMQCHDP